MISRKSAKLIAEAYAGHFKGGLLNGGFTGFYWSGNELKSDTIQNFFYEEDYEVWFLQAMRKFPTTPYRAHLISAIMELHTGNTQVPATKDWDWPQRRELGQRMLKKLAEDILKLYDSIPEREVDFSKAETKEQISLLRSFKTIDRPAFVVINKLKSQLELDGYVYREGILYPAESSVIKEEEEQSVLEMLVKKLALANSNIILNHLKLSEEHYLNNKWGDSISNSRNFLEAILESISHTLHAKNGLATSLPDRPVLVRDFLEQQGFIDRVEKDAISKVYGLISNTGAHPNIAEKDQARLMRHLALSFSQFALLRWEGYLKNNP